MKIIFNNNDYYTSLIWAGMNTLYSGRKHLVHNFIDRALNAAQLVLIIYYKSNVIINKLCYAIKYELLLAETE